MVEAFYEEDCGVSWFGVSHATGDGASVRAAARAGLFGEPAWWHVMGFESGPPRSIADVERRFRSLAARAHPDRGGTAEQMQRLVRARAQARRQLSLRR